MQDLLDVLYAKLYMRVEASTNSFLSRLILKYSDKADGLIKVKFNYG